MEGTDQAVQQMLGERRYTNSVEEIVDYHLPGEGRPQRSEELPTYCATSDDLQSLHRGTVNRMTR